MPAAGGWGCENASPSTNYVAAIATDGAGGILVTVQNIPGVAGNVSLRRERESSLVGQCHRVFHRTTWRYRKGQPLLNVVDKKLVIQIEPELNSLGLGLIPAWACE